MKHGMVVGLVACVAFAGALPALAQTAGPGKPPVMGMDPAAAEAGAYRLDMRHNSLIARVKHLGLGFTAVRFDKVSGTLDWNPADIGAAKVNITIDPKLISTNVPDGLGGGTFAQQIAGPQFLDAYTFPTATFVSTKVTKTDASHGTIEGNLTLHGVTKPVTISAELLGAGTDNRGEPRVAFTGTAAFNRRDFGITAFPNDFVGDEVRLLIDVEFCKSQQPCQ